jgi:D-alanine-D-alanine ligase
VSLNGQTKIVVLAGGPSCEREISLISGKAVAEALNSRGMRAVLLDPVGDFIPALKRENPSMVFLALHGSFGEDGSVQRILEAQKIPYTGSGPEASEKGFHKAKAQAIFKAAGIPVPQFQTFQKNGRVLFPDFLSLPCVVKPSSAGSSVGVSIVSSQSEFEQAVLEAFRYSDIILVEEYIRGRELTVSILGDEVLPLVEIIPQRSFYDYEAKYKDSGTRYECPAALGVSVSEELVRLAQSAYQTLGCRVMGRVDIILSKNGRPSVLEINTIPGLTGKSLLPKAAKAYGIDFPELCVRIIELSKISSDELTEDFHGQTHKVKA